MLLKTYRSPDLASALALARAELGPDALVLATREIKTRRGIGAVEVTVGAPRHEEAARQEVTEQILRGLADQVRDRQRNTGIPRPKTPPVEPMQADPEEVGIKPSLRPTVELLVDTGLSRELAIRFATLAEKDLEDGASGTTVRRAAGRAMSRLMRFGPMPEGKRCMFVIGSPGCGKTTTVAKLAARHTVLGNRQVHFATADTDRIGSVEQAEIYSKHIGSMLTPVSNPAQLREAVNRIGSGDTMLIDTPGIGAKDSDRLRRLQAMRDELPDAEVALLLPAGLHTAEASRIIDRFTPLKLTCLALSRVDDGCRIGAVVTAAIRSKLPLSFMTNGHRVPDDLADASPAALAAIMLRSSCNRERSQEI